MSKRALLDSGVMLMNAFCDLNQIPIPPVFIRPSTEWQFGACAYYRPVKIEICLERCAAIGVAGMAWSYPGYVIDRTPHGVIAHELGHHVDVRMGGVNVGYRSIFSINLRKQSGEQPITNYCPNDGEWFAEMFRLFITNPELLQILRPRTYALIRELCRPVIAASWQDVLRHAPERTKQACARKVQLATLPTKE